MVVPKKQCVNIVSYLRGTRSEVNQESSLCPWEKLNPKILSVFVVFGLTAMLKLEIIVCFLCFFLSVHSGSTKRIDYSKHSRRNKVRI